MTETVIQSRFEAWTNGVTEFPMVDACVRSLRETGWLNFLNAGDDRFFCHLHLVVGLASHQ